MKIFTCEKCGTSIKLHFIKGYVHLRCPACGAEYQLDTGSLKKYMLIPLLSVALVPACDFCREEQLISNVSIY